jgi:hypothetical protein
VNGNGMTHPTKKERLAYLKAHKIHATYETDWLISELEKAWKALADLAEVGPCGDHECDDMYRVERMADRARRALEE